MKVRYFIGGIVGVVILGAAYYGISPLFRNVKVDEALPGGNAVVQNADGSAALGSAKAEVVGTVGHPASGTVRVVEDEGKTYIRYEEYTTINGPDIYVYLSKDLDAKEFVSLGEVKATEGNINYEVPATVDVADYPYVLTWCKAFGVLFNSADLRTVREV